jgi:hypothetical protein
MTSEVVAHGHHLLPVKNDDQEFEKVDEKLIVGRFANPRMELIVPFFKVIEISGHHRCATARF